jgi:hypothetical protein
MSSIPTNLFSVSGIKREPAKASVWVEIKMIVRSVKDAWTPKNENEPVETYMNY